MKELKIYDNGGKTLDRFTIFIEPTKELKKGNKVLDCIGADETGAGFCQHCTGTPGRHLGRLVKFDDLNQSLQAKVREELSIE